MPYHIRAAAALLFLVSFTACAEDPPSLAALRTEANAALRAGDSQRVAAACAQIKSLFPDQADAAVSRGDLLLRAGLPRESLKAWNEVVRLNPAAEPYLWQRGIAQYYAGEYEAGRRQFELHRSVNPNDVENAVWHFLCVAASDGVQAARDAYLPAPGDPRRPMDEIHELFAGRGAPEDVRAAVQDVDAEQAGGKDARFYAHLYLALHADALDHQAEAKREIDSAVALGLTHYMADVARLHQQHLQRSAGDQRSEDK